MAITEAKLVVHQPLAPQPTAPVADVSRASVRSKGCPSQKLLQMIGDKWTLLLLHTLHGRTVRYLQLQREIEGISQKMLSQTLFGLERHGLVYRKVYAVVPPRVEYSLTPLGESLVPRLSPLLEWCEASYSSVEKAKAEYDAKRASLAEDLSL